MAALMFAVAGGGLGFWLGRYSELPSLPLPPSLSAAVPSDFDLHDDHDHGGYDDSADLDAFAGYLDQLPAVDPGAADVDALAARLGEMQAELMRLNALGERLVQMAGLNSEEFDFTKPPPQGGPDDGPLKDYTIKEIASELGSVVSLVKDRKRKLDILEESIMERDLTAQSVPSGWPVRSGYITSNYGYRIHPIKRKRRFHQGIDFAAPRGSPVVAVADGVVTFSGKKGGYGRIVEIKHVGGLITRYAHNQANLVKEGQMVRRGQKIASVGSSGTATGPHCHFEVLKDGSAVNPKRYIGSRTSGTLAAADHAG